jgi:hypothetical protein
MFYDLHDYQFFEPEFYDELIYRYAAAENYHKYFHQVGSQRAHTNMIYTSTHADQENLP